MKIIAVPRTTPVQELADQIDQAVAALRSGGIVVFPTETTYGAGVDATNQSAVDKLLAYKSRREGKPLSIAVTDTEMASRYVELNDQARTLYKQFLPGPVTVVSRGRGAVAVGVESEFGTLGIRIPDYPLVLELVRRLGKPITATGANGSGERRPYAVQDIFDTISEKQRSLIDLVLDAGALPSNPPSTVIDTTLSTPVTLRQGEVRLAAAGDGQKNGVVAEATGATAALELSSGSEAETKRIAGQLLLKYWDELQRGAIVIGLDGELGVGKTVFTKGVAEFLKIPQPITSPTYAYVEEYPFTRHQTTGRLLHYDMWKIDNVATFEALQVANELLPKTVIVVEWWQQVSVYMQPLLANKAVTFIHCSMAEMNRNEERTLHIIEQTDFRREKS